MCPRFGFLRHGVTCVIWAFDLRFCVTWGCSCASPLRHGFVVCDTGVTQVTHDDADIRVCVTLVSAVQGPFSVGCDAGDAESSYLGKREGVVSVVVRGSRREEGAAARRVLGVVLRTELQEERPSCTATRGTTSTGYAYGSGPATSHRASRAGASSPPSASVGTVGPWSEPWHGCPAVAACTVATSARPTIFWHSLASPRL